MISGIISSLFRQTKTIKSQAMHERNEVTKADILVTINVRIKPKSSLIMKPLNGKILAGKVLVKPYEPDEKTARGIIIPDSAKEKPQRGEVILVGKAKEDEPMEVKKGDHVLYSKYAGKELTINKQDYLLMSQSDILFIKQ
jgi:chaperonin GroES